MFVNDPDHFDQHFLVDDSVIDSFIETSCFNTDDIVVEIGPGKGVLTKLITKKVKKLYCIELDSRLKPYLDDICKSNDNVEVIYSNVLDIDIPVCNKIVTALPYSIIEPFMNKMIKTNFEELIMIIGSKFASSAEQNEISYLSLLTNCFFEFEKVLDINPNSFNPPPRTMSAIIKLKPKKRESNRVYSFFKKMYLLNHKKIKNGLTESFIFSGDCKTKNEAKRILESMNLSEEILETKFEVCSNEQLLLLYNAIKSYYNDKYDDLS